MSAHSAADLAVGGARDVGAGGASPLRHDPNPGLRSLILHAVYDLLWLLVVVGGAPWLAWRALRAPGFRRHLGERATLTGLPRLAPTDRPRLLIHGVSVGEVKGAQSLVQLLERERPDVEVVVSTTTDTGMEVARSLFPDHTVVRFPADLSFVVRRFFRALAPTAIVLIELEIWPNFLRRANRLGLPIAVANGRITEESFSRYRLFKRVFPQFNRISLFCVQSETYAERFRALQVAPERVAVTGNVKADGLPVGRKQPGDELTRLVGARPGQPVLVAGSTHEPEERWITEAWASAAREARLVLVPRHPPRSGEVLAGLAQLGLSAQRLTSLREGTEQPDPSRPLVVDTIGELERVYALADLVVIGGSLIPHGGQNLLEPAAQGVPVVCGPHMENFAQEVALLEEAGACRRVAGRGALGAALAALLGDPGLRSEIGDAGRRAVEAQRGATAKTWSGLEGVCLPVAEGGARARSAR